MSEFQELIKSFSKSRNYIRDFLIYGFKSRGDFSAKSGRTYDNERRRTESWLSQYIRADYCPQGKTVSLALDSSLLSSNPLYRVWKSKSFTSNDIVLHFLFLDLFRAGELLTADGLTDRILAEYGLLFEVQLVRKKANEYAREGILRAVKNGRKLLYSLAPSLQESIPAPLLGRLLHAVCFCQLDAPLGFVGSSILDRLGTVNEFFLVKHGYYSFTLEDEILFTLLEAMKKQCMVLAVNQSTKSARKASFCTVPLRIFISTRSGRRFLCGYQPGKHRFSTLRLDHIQSVEILDPFPDYLYYKEKLLKNLPSCFGVSFGANHGMDTVRLTLRAKEGAEDYILWRLQREGRGGTVTRTGTDTCVYEISVFDGNEMLPWIRTFTGRILSFESNNRHLQQTFYHDLHLMAGMYGIQE